MTHYIFKLALPINELLLPIPNSDLDRTNDSNLLKQYLESVDLYIDATELGLSNILVNVTYCGIADDSDLPSMLKYYFNLKHMTYDIEGSYLLEEHFNSHGVYECLTLQSSFQISDEFIKNYNNSLEDDEDGIWDVISASFYENNEFSIITTATDIYTDLFYSMTGKMIALLNLAIPGSVSANCAFINRMTICEESGLSLPNIKNFKFTSLNNYVSYIIFNKLKKVELVEVWEWAIKLNIFSVSKKNHNTNINRALNCYLTLFCEETTIKTGLLAAVAGLECLFVQPYVSKPSKKRPLSKQKQLITNIPKLIDITQIYIDGKIDDIILKLYDERSKIVHGDKHTSDPFIKDYTRNEELLYSTSNAVCILIYSLREL